MSRGQKNSLAKMMRCSPCCQQGNQLRLGPKANPYVSTWFCSKLPASLRGRQGIRWGSFLSPRFWSASGGRIFPTPGQQEGFSPSRFEFFHSFLAVGKFQQTRRLGDGTQFINGIKKGPPALAQNRTAGNLQPDLGSNLDIPILQMAFNLNDLIFILYPLRRPI